MSHPKDWTEEENFDLTLSQRTEELYRIANREADADGMIEAAVLPLRDMVIFPRMVSPIFIGREASLLAVEEAQRKGQTVIGLTQSDPDIDDPGAEDFLPIGVEMAVGRLFAMPDGSHSALVQGRRRVEIVEFIRSEAVFESASPRRFRNLKLATDKRSHDAFGVGSLRALRAVGSFDSRRSAFVCIEYCRARLAGGYDLDVAVVDV
jgi:Lon protease-like protein